MNSDSTPRPPQSPDTLDPIGLCRTCLHAKIIATPRGSTFYLCRLSESDRRFPKYPRLPVIRCAGHIRK